jgi:hypothetical protein
MGEECKRVERRIGETRDELKEVNFSIKNQLTVERSLGGTLEKLRV